jgi:uncharacterized protein YndB with AHSA1/START domain
MRLTITYAATALLSAGLLQPAIAAKKEAVVKESIETTASPEKVWSVIGDFAGIADWLPPAGSSPATNGNTPGSVRTITLKAPGGPTVIEKLLKYDGEKFSYTYAIEKVDPKVLPVVHYHSTISVKADKKGTKIMWVGKFDPAPGVDAATAEKGVSGLYQGGLANAKALAEK